VAIFDQNKFADWLQTNKVGPYGIGQCATYVRKALEAAGCNTSGHPSAAKDWGPTLVRIGFQQIDLKGTYTAEKGDIVVFEASPATPEYGHMGGFDGSHWISDFQQDDMWPSKRARVQKTPYKIYRIVGGNVPRSTWN